MESAAERHDEARREREWSRREPSDMDEAPGRGERAERANQSNRGVEYGQRDGKTVKAAMKKTGKDCCRKFKSITQR